MLVDQTEGCEVYGASTKYFAVNDFRQLEDVSSIEHSIWLHKSYLKFYLVRAATSIFHH